MGNETKNAQIFHSLSTGGCGFGPDPCRLRPSVAAEYDFPKERQKYIADRQRPGREYTWRGPDGRERRFIDPPSYNRAKDEVELRKAKAFAAKSRKRVKAEQA